MCEFCTMIMWSICPSIHLHCTKFSLPRSTAFLLSNLSVSMVTEGWKRQVEVEYALWVSLDYFLHSPVRSARPKILRLNDLECPGRGAHRMPFLMRFHCRHKNAVRSGFLAPLICTVSLSCFLFSRVALCVIIIKKKGFLFKHRSNISD